MKNQYISICIPVEEQTAYLKEALNAYSHQTYKQFEIIVSSTKPFFTPYSFVKVVTDKNLAADPAAKRNKVLEYGKGDIFVFNDDDTIVPPTYLENIINLFKKKEILIAGGPLLTHPDDSLRQQGSGAVWESWLGSKGAGIYRSRLMPARIVYDYPASNLIVRQKTFREVGGFQPGIYPGEDTKLCLDIYNRFHVGVQYDPKLYVYHHRKPLFKAHLSQIGRYGSQRGRFALSFPETSFKLSYFLPSFFLLYLICTIGMLLAYQLKIINFQFLLLTLIPLLLYLSLVLLEGTVLAIRKNISLAFLAMLGIVVTHLYYGWRFLQSFTGKLIKKLLELLSK